MVIFGRQGFSTRIFHGLECLSFRALGRDPFNEWRRFGGDRTFWDNGLLDLLPVQPV